MTPPAGRPSNRVATMLDRTTAQNLRNELRWQEEAAFRTLSRARQTPKGSSRDAARKAALRHRVRIILIRRILKGGAIT
jgi:hypothetical protein